MKKKSSSRKFIHNLFVLWFVLESAFAPVVFSHSTQNTPSQQRSQEQKNKDVALLLEKLKAIVEEQKALKSSTEQEQCHVSSPARDTASESEKEKLREKINNNNVCVSFDKEDYKKKLPDENLNPSHDSETQIRLFLKYMIPLSIHFQEKYGIPADLHLSNAILASSWGVSDHFLKYNNPFAVKCNEVDGPKERLKCSPDGKYFHFDNFYEAFDFHIRLVYFSDHYPVIKKQVQELKKDGDKILDRSKIIPIKKLNSPGLTQTEKALLESWNKFGEFDSRKDQLSYDEKLNILLKDWFTRVDYKKISICKGKKPKDPAPPLSDPQAGDEAPPPRTQIPPGPISVPQLSAEQEARLRESFNEERNYGHYSRRSFEAYGTNYTRKYNPGSEENFNDFVLIENTLHLQPPIKASLTTITSTFGFRVNSYNELREHGGIDVGAKEETPLYSVGRGIVKKSGYSTSYGFYVLIQLLDENGNETPFSVLYAHLKGEETRNEKEHIRYIENGNKLNGPLRGRLQARTGDFVDNNTVVGLVGNTGDSNGAHLHFELLYHWEDNKNREDHNAVYTEPYRLNPEFYPRIRRILGMNKRKSDSYKQYANSDHKHKYSSNPSILTNGFYYK